MPMRYCCVLPLVLFLPRPLIGQSVSTASVAGRVVSQTGAPLYAVVSAEPAAKGAPVRLATAMDGSFTFPALSAGQWSLCATIPTEQLPKGSQPFLNGCAWGSPEAVVQVAAGKNVSGLKLAPQTGIVELVIVNDPQGGLASAAPNAAGLDGQIQLLFRAADRIPRLPVLASSGPQGRTYSIVISLATPLTFQAVFQQGKVTDSAGNLVLGETPVQVAAGAQALPITLTVSQD